MIVRAAVDLERASESLSRLDAAVGDGDHGTTVAHGFRDAATALGNEAHDLTDAGEVLRRVGQLLSSTMPGASGALYGTYFSSAGDSWASGDGLPLPRLAMAFREASAAIARRGRAGPGDATMLDAMVPFGDTLSAVADRDATLGAALAAAAAAARAGAVRTADMVPRRGRARSIGERALGHQDPGATSFAVICEAMAAVMAEEPR